jgi:hypothetical protein
MVAYWLACIRRDLEAAGLPVERLTVIEDARPLSRRWLSAREYARARDRVVEQARDWARRHPRDTAA